MIFQRLLVCDQDCTKTTEQNWTDSLSPKQTWSIFGAGPDKETEPVITSLFGYHCETQHFYTFWLMFQGIMIR